MDLISGAIIGGLIYDTIKLGVTDYFTCIKVALKDYLLTEEEHKLILEDLVNAEPEDMQDKESLTKYFENNAQNTKNIIKQPKITVTHLGTGNNIVHAGRGDIILEQKNNQKKS